MEPPLFVFACHTGKGSMSGKKGGRGGGSHSNVYEHVDARVYAASERNRA